MKILAPVHRHSRRAAALALACASALVSACQEPPAADPTPSDAAPVDVSSAGPTDEPGVTAPGSNAPTLDRLFVYLPGDAISVAYDRTSQKLDPEVLEVVFAIPPKAGDLLGERKMLAEGLDVTLDGDAEPSQWLGTTSLGFTLPIGHTPYFLIPLTRPRAEVGPLLAGSFHRSEAEGVEVWLPSGSFSWRVALLDDDIAAFIPIDVVGTGVEALLAARELERSAIETELTGVLSQDPQLELVLVSGQPMVHFDVEQTIAQVQFGLRRLGDGFEGQVVLAPTADVDRCLEQLRARTHPEENQQVQGLIKAVEFLLERGGVVGRLAVAPDQVKHFVDR